MACMAKPQSPGCPGPPPPTETKVKIMIQVTPSNLCAYCSRVVDSKINIRARRNSIDQLAANSTGLQLLSEWKDRADRIVIELFQQEIGRAGIVPCNYAFCLAGSGARGEACPYSDLDCFLLVETVSVETKDYFRGVSTKVRDMLLDMDEIAGLQFCMGGLNPLGQLNARERPELILTPVEMAALIENPAIDKHISGSLGEYRLLCGSAGSDRIMEAYKTEVNLILAKTCITFSSRPSLTTSRKDGLQSIREALKFKVPDKEAATWDMKMDFYRLPQLVVKGLRLYYGIEAVSTASAITELSQKGKLSANMARGLTELMDVLTGIRAKAQLHSRQELNEVYTTAPLNPGKNYVLSDMELQALKGQWFFLKRLYDRAQQFLTAKEQILIIGKRGNPFAEN